MDNRSKLYRMAVVGLMAAVMCLLGPWSIPIGVVPISFTNLVIYLAVYALGRKKSTISCVIYLLIGLIGLPVFSNFTGGASKLLGPTGGYLLGFAFMAWIAGSFIDRFLNQWVLCFTGLVLGTAVCYALGTVWLAHQAGLSARAALAAGVIPFIPGDLAKIAIATLIGPQLRQRLIRANLF
ncbi:MAG: biotin transporter BioY [Bacillota bacterium]|jgi:biotin transport system substrate-specific component